MENFFIVSVKQHLNRVIEIRYLKKNNNNNNIFKKGLFLIRATNSTPTNGKKSTYNDAEQINTQPH